MSGRIFRIVTRGSALALAQTRQTAERLQRANPGRAFDIITVTTSGDTIADRPLAQFGGVGVFVKELEAALLEGRADIAVHSLKDVPSTLAKGLILASFPQRVDPSDAGLTADGRLLRELPQGARVGTGSPRRIVQIRALRPDFRFADIRGNLDTRIRKMREGAYDAIIVAAAGMIRLGIPFSPAAVLPFNQCLPACGQGALAIECRPDDPEACAVVKAIGDPSVEREVAVERSFMARIGAGCAAPMAALARVNGDGVRMEAMAGDPATGAIARVVMESRGGDDATAGVTLADRLLERCIRQGIVMTAPSREEKP